MTIIMSNTNKNYAEIREIPADNIVTWQTKQSQENVTNTSFKYLEEFSSVIDKTVKQTLGAKKSELRNIFLVFSCFLQSAHITKIITWFLNKKRNPFLG